MAHDTKNMKISIYTKCFCMVQYEMGSENLFTYMNHQAIKKLKVTLRKLFFFKQRMQMLCGA